MYRRVRLFHLPLLVALPIAALSLLRPRVGNARPTENFAGVRCVWTRDAVAVECWHAPIPLAQPIGVYSLARRAATRDLPFTWGIDVDGWLSPAPGTAAGQRLYRYDYLEVHPGVVVQLGLAVSLVAILVEIYLRGRHDAAPRDRCAECGYDLRGSPDRCPECGAVPNWEPE